MQEGQLLLCSFSGVDIGFRSITFADALISLEYIYHFKIPVKRWEGLLGQIQWFFFSFFISNGCHLKQATHPIFGILV